MIEQIDQARRGQPDALARLLEGYPQRSSDACGPSPSEGAARREQAVIPADAVTKLSEDRRRVYELRALARLAFEDVAVRMNRSVGAVRMLWARAVEELSETLGKDHA